MKNFKLLLLFILISFSQFSYANDEHKEGEKLYTTHCAVCHGSTGGMDFTKRLAPPIAAVRLHYIDVHQDKESFVNAVTGWVENQDPNKSLMQGAIRKFKIMPPITISKEDSQKIAEYMYAGKIEELEGYKKHVEEEHGKEGKMHNKSLHKNNKKKDHGSRKGQGKSKKMDQLNLTTDQQIKIKALKAERKALIKPLKKQLKQIKKSIKALDTSSPTYKADIFSLADKKASLVHRIVIEEGEMRFKFDSLLTPDQKAQVKLMTKNKKKGHRGKHHSKKHKKMHGNKHKSKHSKTEMK